MKFSTRDAGVYGVMLALSMTATTLWLRARASDVGDPAPPEPPSIEPAPFVATNAPPVDTAPVAPVDEAARVAELARRSLSTGESLEIIAALEGMTRTATPESLDALGTLASTSEDVEVRLDAVDVLRALAANRGDADGSIRSVLRGLNGGIDTQVAEAGQDIAAEMDATPGGFAQASSAAIRNQDQYAAIEPMP